MKKNYTIIKLMNRNGFISYNKFIAKKIGIAEAILLGELCSVFEYFDCNEFYFEYEKIENDTALSKFQIRKAIKNLEAYGLLKVTKKGIPCRNYYDINVNQMIELLNEDKKTNENKQSETSAECENLTTRSEEIKPKMFKNLTSCGEKTEPLFKKNTEKNTENKITYNIQKLKKHKLGTFKNVLLSESEKEKLDTQLGVEKANAVIDNFSELKEMKGYKYKSDYLALKKWGIEAFEKRNRAQYTSSNQRYRENYTDAERMAESDNDRLDEIGF